MYDFLWSVVRLALASLLTGAGLSFLHVGPDDLLAAVGLSRDEALALVDQALGWALPNMALGGAVIVPLWLVAYLLRPPRAAARE